MLIGNPLEEEYAHSVFYGNVSGLNRENGWIQLSIPSYGGASGSPIFNNKGNVIGVFVATARRLEESEQAGITAAAEASVSRVYQVTDAEMVGFAIPINFAQSLLNLARD